MKNKTLILAATILALGLGGGMVYAVTQYSSLKQQELENTARHQCAMRSRYETQDETGAFVSYPMEELYQQCLKELGI